jgi:MGT family glycosyltransferase
MATILVFGLPGQGRVNPTLPLVKELVRRGEQVIYYSLENVQPVIEQAGAIFRSYGDAYPFDPNVGYGNQFQYLLQYMQVSRLILERLLPEIREVQPNYIMHDQLCTWGRYLAQILNVPTICFYPSFILTPQLIFSDPAQLRNRIASQVLVRQIGAIAAQISASYSVKKMNLFDLANNAGQLNIVFTSKLFQPNSGNFDETYKFVGPSLMPRDDAPVFPYEALDKDRPLIYISLGTIFNEQPEFYRLCFTAFAQSRYQVVLSIGHKTPISSLGDIPENFIVRNFVPQLDILRRTALFVSHGGTNSANEALYYGVPLIIIPQSIDQPWVARRVALLKAGKMLHRDRMQASTLRRVTDEILANSAYAQASVRIGETLRQAGGYLRAADEIQSFMQKVSYYAVKEPVTLGAALMERVVRWTS